MARKYSKGKKPEETVRQRQQRLLREQQARKAAQTKVKTNPASSTPRGAQGPRTAPQQGPSQRTNGLQGTRKRTAVRRSAPKPEFSTSTKVSSKQKALPPGKKGGALATTKGARRRNVNRNPSKGTQMGTRGSAKPQLRLPKGTIRSASTASKALSTTGKVAGRIALPISAYQTGKDLKDSLDRGEGYARVPGMVKRLVKGTGKNKTTGAKTNSRGRRVGAVPASKTKPAGKVPAKRGMSNIPPKEAQPGSPSYVKPESTGGSGSGSSGGSSGGGRNNVTPTTSTKKTGANDSRNAAYIAARKKLNSNSTKAERDKVRDMGLALSKSIHGDKGGRGSKKPKTSKPANVGPVKDGAKYARSLAKSGVRRGAKNAAKADNRLQATESVRAGMRQGRTADKNNEKKKKQRRFSNESLRRAAQNTYNRGSA